MQIWVVLGDAHYKPLLYVPGSLCVGMIPIQTILAVQSSVSPQFTVLSIFVI